MIYRDNSCNRFLLSFVVFVLSGILAVAISAPIYAQAVQPTGQANPTTQNPQPQANQSLGSPRTQVQSNDTQQLLGTSLNQLPGSPLPLRVSQPSATLASPQAADPGMEQAPDRSSATEPRSNLPFIISTVLLLLILGFGGTLWINKKKSAAGSPTS